MDGGPRSAPAGDREGEHEQGHAAGVLHLHAAVHRAPLNIFHIKNMAKAYQTCAHGSHESSRIGEDS